MFLRFLEYKNMPRYFTGFCCLILTLLLQHPATANEQLIFATVLDSQDNEMATAALEAAYQRLGIDISVSYLPAGEALQRANAGELDGEVQRIDGISRSYPNLVQVPIPINYIQGAVFSKNPDLNLHGWYGLKPFRIGLVKGVLFAEKGTRGMQTRVTDTYAQLIDLLLTDQIDLMVVPYVNGLVSIREHPRGGELHLNGILETFLLYHYLHKKHEQLVPAITKVLKAMLLDGTITDLRRKTVSRLTKGARP